MVSDKNFLKMFITNKVNGIGEILSQDATMTTVYWADTDKTNKMITAYLPTTYATIEEAECALNPKDDAETMEAIYSANVEANKIAASNRGASEWLATKNRENAMNSRPSSMR